MGKVDPVWQYLFQCKVKLYPIHLPGITIVFNATSIQTGQISHFFLIFNFVVVSVLWSDLLT